MNLERTRFAADEIKEFLASSGTSNPLIESYLAQYLLIAFYSETEAIIAKTIKNRLDEVDDGKISSFIYLTSEAMIRRVRKADINDVLQKFGCGTGDLIAEHLQEREYQLYSAVITNRHNVSHGDGAQMTLSEIMEAIPYAEKIFMTVKQLLSADLPPPVEVPDVENPASA